MAHSLARGLARGLSESSKEVMCGISAGLVHPLVWGGSGLFLLLNNAKASQTGFSFIFVFVGSDTSKVVVS